MSAIIALLIQFLPTLLKLLGLAVGLLLIMIAH